MALAGSFRRHGRGWQGGFTSHGHCCLAPLHPSAGAAAAAACSPCPQVCSDSKEQALRDPPACGSTAARSSQSPACKTCLGAGRAGEARNVDQGRNQRQAAAAAAAALWLPVTHGGAHGRRMRGARSRTGEHVVQEMHAGQVWRGQGPQVNEIPKCLIVRVWSDGTDNTTESSPAACPVCVCVCAHGMWVHTSKPRPRPQPPTAAPCLLPSPATPVAPGAPSRTVSHGNRGQRVASVHAVLGGELEINVLAAVVGALQGPRSRGAGTTGVGGGLCRAAASLTSLSSAPPRPAPPACLAGAQPNIHHSPPPACCINRHPPPAAARS